MGRNGADEDRTTKQTRQINTSTTANHQKTERDM